MSDDTIVSDPAVMMGKPVIRGTRITAELILEKLAHGDSMETILNAHHNLSKEMVLAAVDYAAKVHKSDVVYTTLV